MAEVVVIGAGPAGLAAGLELARAGHHCRILEASHVVGGMSGSFEIAGMRVDHGSHRFHPAAPPRIRSLVDDLLGPDLQRRPRNGRLRLADRWVGFPLRTGELLGALPPSLTIRLLADAAGTTIGHLGRSRPEPESFAAAVTARLGPTVASEFYGPYARKLYGLEAEELAAELARRRVAAGSPIDIARRLVRARRPSGREFLYPRRGYGQIVERLAEAASEAGAVIELGTPVDRIEIRDDGVGDTAAGDTAVGNNGVVVEAGGSVATVRAVLSTIPVGRLAQVIDPGPPPDVAAAIRRRRTRGMVLVYLVVPRPRYTPFDAHYIPGPETPVARLSEPKNYRDGDDPTGLTVLCAEIPCWPGEAQGTSADDLAALVVDGLDRLGLPAVEPIEVAVRHLRSVYPVYDRGGADDRARVDDWLADLGPVLSLGRQGLGVIDNLHHVLAMGLDGARVVATDGSIRAEAWRADLARYATNTVED